MFAAVVPIQYCRSLTEAPPLSLFKKLTELGVLEIFIASLFTIIIDSSLSMI